ncbi:threonine/serine exporter family protein [Verrucomicrobiaceae bacterium R5-34]|uniref:Threonine/serine exporter family protein n=1 Tax=Oceaniferula flava TaxID=2800421 RepID=A0AAE2SCC4_9BACT|nr:threonine/serine exporter family protein [Oceaniferula flavus]MBK1831984.1 threonine/serine exporter family protein [Verrucomicrobiaceae bacterium R5-34]MBK1855248.1 threonine/serine exporter family protein [Oceaniferula flavus]MBM1136554.1 threonine/serine exporter family protein [Oceaniferula flavus]
MTEEEYLKKAAFVSELGLALHECGATSHRIEKHLTNLCGVLGINGSFLINATSITSCFWLHDKTDQHIHIERVHPADGDLGKLELIDALVDQVESGECNFSQARDELQQIFRMGPSYGHFTSLIGAVVLSASFAALMSFNYNNVIVAALATIVIFYLNKLGGKVDRLSDTIEIVSAMLAGIMATGIAAIGVKINVPFVILSTIVIFIPGLALTTSLSEIACRILISGTSKLVHAVMTLFKLYFGSILGVGIGVLLWGAGAGDDLHGIHNMPQWKTLPAIALLSISLTVCFNIRPQRMLWCAVAALIGFYVARSGEQHFGVASGMFLGAFCVGIFANFYANLSRIPSSIILSGGLVVLVPGSKTYLLLNSWITGEQIADHYTNGTQAFLIFISLVIGLLFANAVLPTKKSL